MTTYRTPGTAASTEPSQEIVKGREGIFAIAEAHAANMRRRIFAILDDLANSASIESFSTEDIISDRWQARDQWSGSYTPSLFKDYDESSRLAGAIYGTDSELSEGDVACETFAHGWALISAHRKLSAAPQAALLSTTMLFYTAILEWAKYHSQTEEAQP